MAVGAAAGPAAAGLGAASAEAFRLAGSAAAPAAPSLAAWVLTAGSTQIESMELLSSAATAGVPVIDDDDACTREQSTRESERISNRPFLAALPDMRSWAFCDIKCSMKYHPRASFAGSGGIYAAPFFSMRVPCEGEPIIKVSVA
jgi:hypothetical protein